MCVTFFGQFRKSTHFYFIIFIILKLIVFIYFFLSSNINIYNATVPDRMHHLDLGLFHYQIDFTQKLLKEQHGKNLVDEIDRRLAAIPRFSGLKIFRKGLSSIARLTADDHRNLMKVMIFVIDNLYDRNTKDAENFIENKDLAQLYEEWNEMYAISRYERFKESDLSKFEVCTVYNYVYQI